MADISLILESMERRLDRMEQKLDNLHTPGDCPVANRVKELELNQAKQKGAITVIGLVAGAIASAIMNLFPRFVK